MPHEKDAAGNVLPEHAHKVGKTCWRVHHGEDFSGPLQPFGRLIFHLSKEHPLEPTTKPGFFIGWRLESGLRYRGVLRILDYDTVVKGKSIAFRSIQDVPEAEVYFPPEITFPFAERRKLAIRTMSDPATVEFSSVIIPDSLPFDDKLIIKGADDEDKLFDLPAKRRTWNITVDRIIKYSPTPGCKACEKLKPGMNHTSECVARFRSKLQEDGVIPIETSTSVTPIEDQVPSKVDVVDPAQEQEDESLIADLFGDFVAEVDPQPVTTSSAPVSSEDILTPQEHFESRRDGGRLSAAVRAFGSLEHFRCYVLPKPKAASSKEVLEELDDVDFSSPLPTVTEILAPGVGCAIPPSFGPSSDKDGVQSIAFDMTDYCRSAVEQYKQLTGVSKLKHAATPYLPEGSLVHADSCERGQMSGVACRVLMKDLWLGRLARPDIVNVISDLATKVQCWSKNEDKKLFRLICYLNSTCHYRLCGKVGDSADKLRLQIGRAHV